MRDIKVEQYGASDRAKVDIGSIVLILDEEEQRELVHKLRKHREPRTSGTFNRTDRG